ncbi:unnamed protein product, partial [Staurois parvus]
MIPNCPGAPCVVSPPLLPPLIEVFFFSCEQHRANQHCPDRG